MPATFLVDVERRIIFLRLSGVVTEEELFTTAKAANNDERAKEGGFDRLIDLSETSQLKISSEGVRRLAEVTREFVVGHRALVATSPVTFGIARMWEQNLLLPPDHSRVFDNLPDAMEFLGLDRDMPWPAEA